ncbi:LysR family transcriptional regulator [Pleionea mediterranea]|uniref:LysR family transcriptional regulator n=1 Tax=Pleionea mediterranea TaxID=523701 RepID=A0A316FBZ8_9GAMM|nr:LysR family transcriptional regulator [Pleionea mediterranea]PWK45377.1 LysR family transcriptional regulator [Pleionea mediterranea]
MHNLDISLLRTFLSLTHTRHFGKTAENLYLTQSAVSARIRQLEDILGVPLFQRFRNNLQLTPQGERLIPHAEQMLATWSTALQDVSRPGISAQLTLGASQPIWQACLSSLPVSLQQSNNDIVVRTESLDAATTLRRLQERTLDIGFTFDAPKVDEISAKKVLTLDLQLYSSEQNKQVSDLNEQDYVLVDAGQSFSALHAKYLPQIRSPRFHASDWNMAMSYLSTIGGFAFLPSRLVDACSSRLFQVEDAPVMRRDIYLCTHVSQPKNQPWKAIMDSINQVISNI